ncbi:methyltransferase domain-containing protein [Streptomyces avicenniae]|uniref:methyltransferase domain-containing protein n=1 Tax=Streptomyces avicenniae TaxID=500153 RepID=UPI000A93C9C5|nr:methyltransferase domain-containing protein [Streptomyces avicenniae]
MPLPLAPIPATGDTPAGIERLLDSIAAHLGHAVPPEWAAAFRAVPRHRFLPGRVWLRDGGGGYAPCDRGREPDRWWAAAYGDTSVVTRIEEDDDGFRRPTSSASAPGAVVRMLQLLGAAPGHTVLEIGTGVGFHAGLLASRLGAAAVTSIDLDAGLVDAARRNLAGVGLRPRLECADGAGGWPPTAPYDRVVATCSVRAVPPAWLRQTRPGGRIVTPWDSAWCPYGTLALTVRAEGSAEGRFHPFGAYMPLRDPAAPGGGFSHDAPAMDAAAESATALSPWAVAGEDLDARFALGLLVPGVWHDWDAAPSERGVAVRLWLADEAGESWAAIDYDGQRHDRYRVRQFGPRRLADEIAAAHAWWAARGRPEVARFGATVTAEGHTVWLDRPDLALPAA